MKKFKVNSLLILFTSILFLSACNQDPKWKGQEPIVRVSTLTKPIQYQLKKTFDLGNGIYCSNDFDGARLNGVVLTNDTLVSALITPENTPINGSPWYAFKIWSNSEKNIYLKLTYLEGVSHRYYPKLSRDGLSWNNLDSINYLPDTTSIMEGGAPSNITMKLFVSTDTLWVAAQELITSKHMQDWTDDLATISYITKSTIGESRDGRPIPVLKIGVADDKKMIIVLSRQHPPEVTGYLAMKAFVEAIATDNELARRFRDEYNTYIIPMVNPDGVDNGHWRHNTGGIDLNRDWEDFNQKETTLVKAFLTNKLESSKGEFYFGVDFHSTFHDIFYTIDPELKGNMPGLVPDMIQAMTEDIPNFDPNIKPGGLDGPKISSTSFLFYELGAESVTFEIGDDTPRDLIKKKGEIAAIKLMELMLK